MICVCCKEEIPAERLKAIPGTQYCVKCSPTQKHKGYMVFDHKTAGVCTIIPRDNLEAIRQADRFNRRAR